MTLRLCGDTSVADWLVGAGTPAMELITFGPRGFADYARLRFIPDPGYPGQAESDVELPADHPSDLAQVAWAMHVLTKFTSTPDSCFFALWEGYPDFPMPRALAHEQVLDLRYRQYALVQGSVADIDTWCEQLGALGGCSPPALAWPADRTWCIAKDVDPHWAGIGGTREAITALIVTAGLDVVRADPAADQPHFL